MTRIGNVTVPDHPLASPRGQVKLHRYRLYEKIGGGAHPCHWCGKTVAWAHERTPGARLLTAEHIDGNRRNNDPSNLAPACERCNHGKVGQPEKREAEREKSRLLIVRCSCGAVIVSRCLGDGPPKEIIQEKACLACRPRSPRPPAASPGTRPPPSRYVFLTYCSCGKQLAMKLIEAGFPPPKPVVRWRDCKACRRKYGTPKEQYRRRRAERGLGPPVSVR